MNRGLTIATGSNFNGGMSVTIHQHDEPELGRSNIARSFSIALDIVPDIEDENVHEWIVQVVNTIAEKLEELIEPLIEARSIYTPRPIEPTDVSVNPEA